MIITRQIKDEWVFAGAIEVNKSYLGGGHKENEGVEPRARYPSLTFCNEEARSKIIPDAKAPTLLPIIREKVVPDSIVYTEYYRSYKALDLSELKHD